MNNEKVKVLIIGSNGFIGSHLRNYFSTKKEFDVYLTDIVKQKSAFKKFILLDGNNIYFDHIFKKQKFDIVINASGSANVQFSVKNPVDDLKLNVNNLMKQLDSIRKFNPETKYINLSSAAVYGNPESLPIKEDSIINPKSPYGYHKYISELLCEEYYKMYNIQNISLRIFSAYGPGLKKQIFWDIYQKIKETGGTGEIELYGTGNETRDFIYISDLVRSIFIVINEAKFDAEVINVANSEEIKIKNVVNTFLHIVNLPIKARFNNQEREGDPKHWRADITKLTKFGYKPEIDIKDGVSRYIKWLKQTEKELV